MAFRVGECDRERFAAGILLNGDERGDAAAFGEDLTYAMAGTLRRDERDVDVCGRIDGAEPDVEAVREHQCLGLAVGAFGLQAGFELLVDLGSGLVGDEEHDDIRPLRGVRGCDNFESGEFCFPGVGGAGAEANFDVHAGVLEVEGVRVALRAVADDGDLLGLDEGEVCVLIVVGLCHDVPSLFERWFDDRALRASAYLLVETIVLVGDGGVWPEVDLAVVQGDQVIA